MPIAKGTKKTLQPEYLFDYKLSDIEKGTTVYLGYLTKEGFWYVLKINKSVSPNTFRYSRGSTNYTTNWTNRASLTYDYFNTVF